MKLSRFSVLALLVLFATSLLGGCSNDDGIDNRDHDYGYIQFKLYKEASYEASTGDAALQSRASSQLDYLAEACKVRITLLYNGTTISQTLTLTATSTEAAEFGLRSDKFKLLTGNYEIVNFTLFDVLDEVLYNGTTSNNEVSIITGGLTVHDLTVNVEPRGKVLFTITKDMSDFTDTPTRASNVDRQYTFDEIAYIDLTVQQTVTNERTIFDHIPAKFSMHFDDDDTTDGYQTSSLACDSLLSLKAGKYKVISYKTYDENKVLLETNTTPNPSIFEIADNITTKAKVAVSLHEADDYLRDYYALYEIWKALDGENWYYHGENWTIGQNWDFNRDPDLWGSQPGVKLHSNGRVAAIDISNFGFRGRVPAAIGQLTQLIELYLGTHNDNNLMDYDPTVEFGVTLNGSGRSRMDRAKEYLSIIHPMTQLSEPIARALTEKNISIPEVALYKKYSEDQIRDRKSGKQLEIRPYDMIHGKLCNGLTEIDPAIGKLTKLEYLYVANSKLASLPDEMAKLESLTDLEIYNCPMMKEFPMVLAKMPALISINLANNKQWSSQDFYNGLNALANGPSKEKIQIAYLRQNKLKEVPLAFNQMKKLGLLDLAYNEIETVHPFGRKVALVQIFFDHNKISSLPVDSEGYFMGYNDLEAVSMSYNEFTKVPNIFNAKSMFTIKSVDFSYNHIDDFEGANDGTFKGINVGTLTLAGNLELTKYPTCLAATESIVSYMNMSGCGLTEFPEGSFTGKNVFHTTSFDLSYNKLTKFPKEEFTAVNLPYLNGIDISYNRFAAFPYQPFNSSELTVFAIRGQRNEAGERCMKEWPLGVYQHKGLRGLYLGSNDIGKVDDTISFLIYYLDISDNPNIVFDASAICYYYRAGSYFLIYDKTQNIKNCDYLFQ